MANQNKIEKENYRPKSSPILIKKWNCRFWFYLANIEYLVEDRRPDMKNFEGKYKHFLTVRILHKRFNWTFRTKYEYEHLPFEN